jgi:hypothetical protein
MQFKLWKVGSIFSILSLAFSRSYADNIDLQFSGLMVDYHTYFYRGMAVSYDIRNPSNRSGWSIAPVVYTKLFMGSMGRESLIPSLFPGLLAKWHYRFGLPLAFDLDLGGVLFFQSRDSSTPNTTTSKKERTDYLNFVPIISIKFSYAFENGKLLGLKLTHTIISYILSINFSVPIERQKSLPDIEVEGIDKASRGEILAL